MITTKDKTQSFDGRKLRQSGVFLPVFSLPSPYGIGTIGKAAKQFVEFLANSGFGYWAILPLGPTGFFDSPFQPLSTTAFNPYLIDFDDLVVKGLLKRRDFISINWGDDPRRIDYSRIYADKIAILKKAYKRFKRGEGDYQRGYNAFLRRKEFENYALYMVLKKTNGDESWDMFPSEERFPSKDLFKKVKSEKKDELEFYQWLQYIFLKQWNELRQYANSRNVKIISEMLYHSSYDSEDVYNNRVYFQLENGVKSLEVYGYPPDVFYSKGQCWGYPVYDYEKLEEDDYSFFKKRLEFNLANYDYVILDHFRGYLENYKVLKGSQDGMKGVWEKAPKGVVELFSKDEKRVVAEDVDFTSDELEATLDKYSIKDMRVLEFGFPREIGNFNQPVNYDYPCISYTSTHDCLPLKAYFQKLNEEEKREAIKQINSCCDHFGVERVSEGREEELVDRILKLNLASLSSIAIQSMPDLLYQGEESRINTPGSLGGNWMYRVTSDDLSPLNAKKLRALNRRYGRCD